MIVTHVLTPAQRGPVLALVRDATAHDGVGPLDEEARLALTDTARTDTAQPTPEDPSAVRHLLVLPTPQEDAPGTDPSDPELPADGYLSLLPDGTVQGVVRPGARRQGLGTRLLAAALAARPDAGVWAHGGLPDSVSFLRGRGLVPVRELLTLSRRLGPDDTFPSASDEPPDGLTTGVFDPARDTEDWLRVNAAAFAAHPEQGRWDAEDLHRRMAEPWFSAADLHVARQDGHLVGFVWIKREPAPADPPGQQDPAEVYVVGTDPAHAGRGIARTLMGRALAALVADGVGEVELYVEADNTAARHLYEGLGFTVAGRDIQFRADAAPADAVPADGVRAEGE
jgi:mycothiol synthase